jgi:hypothetical protein
MIADGLKVNNRLLKLDLVRKFHEYTFLFLCLMCMIERVESAGFVVVACLFE